MPKLSTAQLNQPILSSTQPVPSAPNDQSAITSNPGIKGDYQTYSIMNGTNSPSSLSSNSISQSVTSIPQASSEDLDYRQTIVKETPIDLEFKETSRANQTAAFQETPDKENSSLPGNAMSLPVQVRDPKESTLVGLTPEILGCGEMTQSDMDQSEDDINPVQFC